MSIRQIQDQDLVKKYIAGNESAFEVLLNRHKDRIYSQIYLMVRDRDLTEDLFQDAFIKIINTLRSGKYNEEGKFLPWVLTISHNMIVDHFRKAKKMQMVSESSSKSEEFNIFSILKLTDNNVEDDMIKDQIESDVVRLVEYLPPEQRDVLKNRIFVGMSFKDIAEQEDISINTALGRMRYALINLRKMIKENDIMLTTY